MYCPKCGTQNASGARFCGKCGASVGSADNVYEAPQQFGSAAGSAGYAAAPRRSGSRKGVLIAGVAAALVVVALLCGWIFGVFGGSGSNSDAKKVAEYVDENRSVLLSSMEQSFATSLGLTCTSSVKAEGCGIVIDINVNELNNVDAAAKAELQAIYDSMDSTWDDYLDEMQKELPELDYFVINVNEKDGTKIASIRAD